MQEGFSPIIAYDTMLAHFLIDERQFAHGLKVLAAKYLGAPDWEEALKVYLPNKKASYDNIPDHILYPYAARDVCYTYQLKKIFEESISERGNGTFAKLLMPCTNMFNDLRHQGVKVDINEIMSLDDYFDTEYEEECTLGDINEDGVIDILDIVTGINIILETISYTDCQSYLLDFNEDGSTDVLDIVEMVNYILPY